MSFVLAPSSHSAALERPMRLASATWIRALGVASLVLACGSQPGPAVESSEPPVDEDARPRPTRPLQLIESQSFALICPEGANLQGEPPPEGSEASCQAPEGRPHGPAARWTPSGELVELHLYSEAGTLQWSLICEQLDGRVAGHWRSGDEEELATLESQRCEEIAQMLLGL